MATSVARRRKTAASPGSAQTSRASSRAPYARFYLAARPRDGRDLSRPFPSLIVPLPGTWKPMDPASHRKGAFFGRRKGHALRPRQATLFETLLPRLALDLSAPAPADLRTLFHDVDEARLESGFGGGEHLTAE